MSPSTEAALSYILAVVIGITGALLLAHWAACESGVCA
jgi:hypothetical protein